MGAKLSPSKTNRELIDGSINLSNLTWYNDTISRYVKVCGFRTQQWKSDN